jgi:hypothetical protein
VGRFLAPDPAPPAAGDPRTLNRYAYCLGDPVDGSDPTGAIAIWDDDGHVDSYELAAHNRAHMIGMARRSRGNATFWRAMAAYWMRTAKERLAVWKARNAARIEREAAYRLARAMSELERQARAGMAQALQYMAVGAELDRVAGALYEASALLSTASLVVGVAGMATSEVGVGLVLVADAAVLQAASGLLSMMASDVTKMRVESGYISEQDIRTNRLLGASSYMPSVSGPGLLTSLGVAAGVVSCGVSWGLAAYELAYY